MKKLLSYWLMCFMALALLPLNAQSRGIPAQKQSILAPTPLVEKNAYGCLITTFVSPSPWGDMENDMSQMGYISLETPSTGKIYLMKDPMQMSPIAGAAANGSYYAYLCMSFFGNTIPVSLSKLDLRDSAEETVVALYNSGMDYFYHDMTYDYSTNTMYAIASLNGSSDGAKFLFTVDISTGSFTIIGDLGQPFVSLACSYDGYLFGVSGSGELYSISKATASSTAIGNTGITPSSKFQSMEFDHSNHYLYWSASDINKKNKLVRLNLSTGGVISADTIVDNMRITGMYIPYTLAQDGAPASISNLGVRADTNSALFSWKNPSLTFAGGNLASLTKIEIYRNDVLVKTIENPTIGANETWKHESLEMGVAYYKIVAHNSIGKGQVKMIKVLVGMDIPAPVNTLSLRKEGKTAHLSWTAPTIGANEGVIDTKTLKYTIKRSPHAYTWTGHATTEFTDNTITELNNYTYEVIALTKDGESKSTFSNTLLIGDALENPYYTQFATALDFSQWTIVNANNDDKTWHKIDQNGQTFARYTASPKLEADDWMISPPIKLKADKTYQLRVGVKTSTDVYSENLSIRMGKGLTPADMNVPLKDKAYRGEYFQNERITFSVDADGEYNFGFHIVSDAAKSSLDFSNVAIEEYGFKDFIGYSVSGPEYPTAGKEYTYSVKVQNNGANAQDNFVVQLYSKSFMSSPFGDMDLSMVMDTILVKENLIPEGIYKTDLKFKASMPGDNELFSISVLDGDINPANDRSILPLKLNVQREGSEYAEILDRSVKTTDLPVNFQGSASCSQTIYLASEIGVDGGLAKEIIYAYDNLNGKVEEKEIKIYMANTSLRNLKSSWVPIEDFVLVAQEKLTFERGSNRIRITLNGKFIYGGENLVIMNMADVDPVFNGAYHYYYGGEDKIAPNRSLAWVGFGENFNFGQKGVLNSFIPFAQIGFNTSNKTVLKGIVKNGDGDPIPNALIEFPELKIKSISNDKGEYIFNYVSRDEHSFSAQAIGYVDHTATLNIDQDTMVYDFSMEKLATYRVYGNVKDVNGLNVSGAQVKISGYAVFKILTDTDGNFSFPSVYTSKSYKVDVFKSGMIQHTSDEFKVENADKNLGTIHLDDVLFTVADVNASVSEGTAKVSWSPAINKTIFRYDDGTVYSSLGANEGNEKTVIGVVYRSPALLSNMSWFTIATQEITHPLVNLFVFDLDAEGNPTSTILFSQKNVPNTDSVWNKFVFPTPVNAARGFMVALSCNSGHLGLANDNSTATSTWPFMPNANYFSGDYTEGNFSSVEASGFLSNLLVRAEGSITSMPNYAPQKIAKREIRASSLSLSQIGTANYKDEEIMRTSNAAKSLAGYRVWRLKVGDEDKPNKWDALTSNAIKDTVYNDNAFSGLSQAFYKYAVRACYSEDYNSDAVISNVVAKDMHTEISITVKTNTPTNESKGAKVSITNADYSYSRTADQSGKVIISNVVKGMYTLRISLDGFADLELANENFSTAPTYNKEYTLTEKIVSPFGLEIVEANLPQNKIFNWNVASTVFDNFESHVDFTLNSAGDLGWNHIDGDKLTPYAIQDATFTNQEKPLAYIAFNPSSAEPAIPNDEFKAFSGKKYIAFFSNTDGKNDDYFISPKLQFNKPFVFSFQIKALSTEYPEKFQVGYSTSGKDANDFTWINKSASRAPAIWTLESHNIPADAKYVCIRYVSDDAFMMMVDDVFIGYKPENTPKAFAKYEVYLNNVKVGETEETTFLFENLKDGDHIAGVKSIYTSGASEIITIPFTMGVGVEDTDNESFRFYPNPAKDKIYIDGRFSQIDMYDISGKIVYSQIGETKYIPTNTLKNGVYILKVNRNDRVNIHKVIIQK